MAHDKDIEELKVLIQAMPGRPALKQLVLERIRIAVNGASIHIFSQLKFRTLGA